MNDHTTPASQNYLSYLVGALKGGPGKTTTAFYIALGLTQAGHNVLAIDADTHSRGLSDWAQLAMLAGTKVPFETFQWARSEGLIVPFIEAQREKTGADRIVIDVGGEDPEAFRSAALYSHHLITPIGPMHGEMRRIPATAAIAVEVDEKSPIDMTVLLTRVPDAGRGAAKEAREYLGKSGFQVFEAEISRRERQYADAWGTVPDDLGEYTGVLAELTTWETGQSNDK